MPQHKPRICFLLYSLEGGGLQKFLLRFIKYFQSEAHISIVIKGPVEGELKNSFKESGATLYFIRSGYLNVSGWVRIAWFFKGGNFDAICDLTANFAGIYMVLGKIANVHHRVAYYGQNSNHFIESGANLFYNRIVNWLVRKFATSIVSNSANALSFFFGPNWTNDYRLKVIDNGIDLEEFESKSGNDIRRELGIPESAFVVGHSGRLDGKKNHETILKVAGNLISGQDDIYFILCGKGTGNLQKQIDDAGLKSKIFAVDFRMDIAAVYKGLDLFYFPSYSEGQSNALIEAMIAGVPVVASNIESNRETIPEFIYQFMVDADDVEAAERIILSLKNKPADYPATQVREWAINRFDARGRFFQFYQTLIGH